MLNGIMQALGGEPVPTPIKNIIPTTPGSGDLNTDELQASGGDILSGQSAIVGDALLGFRTGGEEQIYARPGGGVSITPLRAFAALSSNNNGPSPENNTVVRRSPVRESTQSSVRVFIGNHEIKDFIIQTVENEL